MDSADRAPLDQLSQAHVAVVSDALDRLGMGDQALDPAIRPLYPGARVVGKAMPIIAETTDRAPREPYQGEIHALRSLRAGDVPVLTVEPGNRAALWGELFSCAARSRGAVGVIVDGYVRDSRQIADLNFPAFARGCSPLDTLGRANVREFDVEAVCGGVKVAPGDYVVADADGALLIPTAALDDVLKTIQPKARKESRAREDLLAGDDLLQVWKRYGVL